MGTPQIICIAMGMGIALLQHGKPKDGKHGFWVHLVSVAITYAFLIWGGFFS